MSKYYATRKRNEEGEKRNEENLYTLINTELQHIVSENKQGKRQCLLYVPFLQKKGNRVCMLKLKNKIN